MYYNLNKCVDFDVCSVEDGSLIHGLSTKVKIYSINRSGNLSTTTIIIIYAARFRRRTFDGHILQRSIDARFCRRTLSARFNDALLSYALMTRCQVVLCMYSRTCLNECHVIGFILPFSAFITG